MTGTFDAGGTRDAGAELTPAQRDLLADYVGGALADTPVEAEVAQWVAADPAWRRAHDTLVAGFSAVQVDLRSWAEAPEPMPDDVAARLAAVLRAEGIGPAPTGAPDAPLAPVVPIGVATGRRRRAAPPRWLGRVAVAAGVLAVAGVGVTVTAELRSGGDEPSRSVADAPGVSPLADERTRAANSPEAVVIQVSGTTYAPAALAGAAALAGERAVTSPDLTKVPPALRRLTDSAALDACLNALRLAHPQTARVRLVDFAAVGGQPALVVVSEDRDRSSAVTALGADCGAVPGNARILRRVAAR
ncbi:hypothetical protein GCM10010123_17030 [Pilimelia anulata]|uniref:Uncharacterized protein n=1 Tax=Pilimelia anulata TaxID=53371 RepID=A0A8J3F8D2_9ACTN|nr:hypothetical protein [Pilimelia anulata]GGJ87998.1 hypothetical protein GCM10010123_17030 [Pilimelia anulata]